MCPLIWRLVLVTGLPAGLKATNNICRAFIKPDGDVSLCSACATLNWAMPLFGAVSLLSLAFVHYLRPKQSHDHNGPGNDEDMIVA